MAIETRFNIGDEVWVPRVYAEVNVDSVVVNGKTYYASATSREARNYTYRPEAKKFMINEIELIVTADGVDELYYGKHISEDGSESTTLYERVYSSKAKNILYFFSKEDALKAAQALADKEEPYYG